MSKYCPNCGYDISSNRYDKDDIREKVNSLMFKHDKSTREIIRKIVQESSKVRIIDLREVYNLMKSIENAKEEVIRHMINEYYKKNMMKDYNFNYLSKMIENANKDNIKKAEVEREMYGTKPPRRTISRDAKV